MNWYGKMLIVFWVLEPIVVTAAMGKKRSPYSAQDSMLQIIVNALMIWGLIANWGH